MAQEDLSRRIARIIASESPRQRTIRINLIPPPPQGWTETEKEVILFTRKMFSETWTSPTAKDIADYRRVSFQTVKNQIHTMMLRQPVLEHYYQLPFLQIE